MTPEELLDSTVTYNEMLVVEKGTKENELDVHFPKLRKIALYCYDKIKKWDVKIAKENGVGIILVDTSKYKLSNNLDLRDVYNKDYIYYNPNDEDYFDNEVYEELRENIKNKFM